MLPAETLKHSEVSELKTGFYKCLVVYKKETQFHFFPNSLKLDQKRIFPSEFSKLQLQKFRITMQDQTPYIPNNKVRIVTAASLFDGHDGAAELSHTAPVSRWAAGPTLRFGRLDAAHTDGRQHQSG
jgi:hypothetical protein